MDEPQGLDKLKVGETGTVNSFAAENPDSLRLMEMGVLPQTRIKLIRKAPLGDPLEIEIRGYKLSLRKSEAKQIFVNCG